jgi:hypothetical protein
MPQATRSDSGSYTLTAEFALPSPPEREQASWNRDGFFQHTAGEQTFRLSAPKNVRP